MVFDQYNQLSSEKKEAKTWGETIKLQEGTDRKSELTDFNLD